MENKLNELIEKDRVRDVVTDLFVFTDNKDWEGAQRCFAKVVILDMSSMTGTKPVSTTGKEITDSWHENLSVLQAIHHQIGNFKIQIDGEKAHCFCYGTASHYLESDKKENTRTFVGAYNFDLIKEKGDWKISMFQFNLKFITGNLDLGT